MIRLKIWNISIRKWKFKPNSWELWKKIWKNWEKLPKSWEIEIYIRFKRKRTIWNNSELGLHNWRRIDRIEKNSLLIARLNLRNIGNNIPISNRKGKKLFLLKNKGKMKRKKSRSKFKELRNKTLKRIKLVTLPFPRMRKPNLRIISLNYRKNQVSISQQLPLLELVL